MADLQTFLPLIRRALGDISLFVSECSGMCLREYQLAPAYAIMRSVLERQGLRFAVMFPRQSGKNELQAQLETYLLCALNMTRAEIVKVSPTWKPQTLNAMRRLERALQGHSIARHLWTKESGYIYRAGSARVTFFSGQPRANIVGATANLLLEVDEAQDILPAKFDKDIAPMAASANATMVFYGTAWTANTLLARELRACQAAQERDGIRRVFTLTADDVRAEAPAYGDFVDAQVARLGRQHPMVRTQYFSEEIDAAGGPFPPERIALMRGDHPQQTAPNVGVVYAMTLDLAGADEGGGEGSEDADGTYGSAGRDSSALTIFEVDLEHMDETLTGKPNYRVVGQREWVEVRHAELYGRIRALAELYDARWLVVDATGVGAGMVSFLKAALGERVIPFLFNTRSKSDLLWDFLGIIGSGRFKFFKGEAQRFWAQARACEFAISPDPGKRVKWGVPAGARDPLTNEALHDDLLISAALCAVLDQQEWSVCFEPFVIEAPDPLEEMDRGF